MSDKKITSWGNYPRVLPKSFTWNLETILKKIQDKQPLIPYGNGRSYGDSALNDYVIDMRSHNLFLDFDEVKGILHVQSGVLLSDVIEVFVPKGWFLQVSPGTKLITIGGAIASDVHGKNHHIQGCFSESVEEFTLLLPDGSLEVCSSLKNQPLFRATCGGMGLTGVIIDAKIRLKKINSKHINQTIIKASSLKDTFEAFEKYKNMPYSVAWIDCLAKGKALGRSLLMIGDFANDSNLSYTPKKRLNIPFYFPSFALNNFTVKAFNFLYYHKVRSSKIQSKVDLEQFFYPLDSIRNWNRIYGKGGFTQYQFILPLSESYKGLEEILTHIALSKKGSFLAVLKLYGKSNENYLSFPMEGYSLALDFKIEPGLFELLEQLDAIVLKYSGRVYLAKDVRLSKENFEKSYPKLPTFREIRKKYGLYEVFSSLQSKRLGI